MKRNDRIRGAMLGAAIADAATRPLHWIYDRERLEQLLANNSTPEFWPQSESPFYTLPTGAHSSYFDVSLVMLRALAQTGGCLDKQEFINAVQAHFGDGTAYEKSWQHRQLVYTPEVREKGWPGPVEGPWRNGLVTNLLSQVREGVDPVGSAEANEADGFCASLPVWLLAETDAQAQTEGQEVIAWLAGTDLCQSHGVVWGHLLRLALQGEMDPIRRLLQQGAELDIAAVVLSEMEEVVAAQGEDHRSFVERVGKACPYPGTFQGALHAVLTSSSLEEGTRKVIRAGGCNCSRAIQAGSLLGALYGEAALSQSWLDRTDSTPELRQLLSTLGCERS